MTFTLSANDPHKMADAAASYTEAQAIKLKLTGEPLDAARVLAVRRARPDALLEGGRQSRLHSSDIGSSHSRAGRSQS